MTGVQTCALPICLHLNVTKCELILHPNHSPNIDILKSLVQVDPEDSSLSGAPLFAGRQLDLVSAQCCFDLSKAIDKLDTINSHDALILLRSSFSAPNSTYSEVLTLRESSCTNFIR